MSTVASQSDVAVNLSGPAYLIVRRLQSLTGLLFGGYLLVHLTVNATIAQGGSVYQDQVNKIHSLPFLEGIEWSAIFLPFLFHAFYGVWIAVNGRPNVSNYPYTRNNAYLLQRISAVVILLFVLFHVLSLKYGLFGKPLTFDPKDVMNTIARHMQTYWWIPVIVYPLGILAAAFHTANGFWGGAITWGLTVTAGSQRRWAYLCAMIGAAMALFGFIALVAAYHLPAILN